MMSLQGDLLRGYQGLPTYEDTMSTTKVKLGKIYNFQVNVS
jgi:hypothetical protein